MEDIMIINERTPFRDGLKSLIELRYGSHFQIVGIESMKLEKVREDKPPRLIIVEHPHNPQTEKFIIDMRKQGAKVILLGLNPESFKGQFDLKMFNGFLMKNMQTDEMLDVIGEILDQDKVYVHPDIGYFFLQKLMSVV